MKILRAKEKATGKLTANTVKNDLFAGIVSAFSVIPEVVGFCLLAGVSPTLGLYTSVAFLVLSAFLGGRPAMISAGAGSMALVVTTLIAGYGTDYLFVAVILAGVIQLVLGVVRADRLIKYVPASVMTGFVNALAIIILMSQLKTLVGETSLMIAFVVLAIGIVYFFPKLTDKVPSTLVALVAVTVLSLATGSTTTSIGALASITSGLPTVALPMLLLDPNALIVVFPYAVSLAFVGLIETLLTQQVVDEMTETQSDTGRESRSQGIINVVCGCIGAMPGCAMIGQAMVNIKSGGRTRLSNLFAGLLLAAMVIVGGALLSYVPLAALVGVMITVAVSTFDWSATKSLLTDSITAANKMVELVAMVITVGVVVFTNNLAIGVGAGMVLFYGANAVINAYQEFEAQFAHEVASVREW